MGSPARSSGAGRRMLVVADADSYLKWAVSRACDAQASWDVELVVVESAVTPSDEQVRAAVDGRWPQPPSSVRFSDLERRLRADPPDALLLACRGPLIEMVMRVLADAGTPSPATACGIPGIWMPPTELGLRLRRGVDLMVVHSKRELRAARELSATVGGPGGFALASLGSTPAEYVVAPLKQVVFASQALVPAEPAQRKAIVAALANVARAHPDLTVVIKERGRPGEEQTHRDREPFPAILESLEDAPRNLVVGYGPMSGYLAPGTALVTVSSTAVLEAIARGVPALCLDDFGISAANINVVFEGSGLLGSTDALEGLDFRMPHDDWLEDNYFHDGAASDWLQHLGGLVDSGPHDARSWGEWPGSGLRTTWQREARRRTALGRRDVWWRRPVTWTAAASLMAVRRVRRGRL